MLPSFAQAFANDSMSTTLPPIRKRPVESEIQNTKKRRIDQQDPISPIGFTVQRDHVRSVKQIRKKQEALIEHRRESAATDDPDPVPPTPTPAITASSSRLPPPPISYANRAINAGKKKPADLLLVNSPSSIRRQPAVQSAPPSQNSFNIPMALPRLPANLTPSPLPPGNGRVPPTPTRLSMQPSGKSPPILPQTPISLALSRHSIHTSNLASSPLLPQQPPSVPSSSSASNSAPNSASVPSAAQAKQAFLAPFELFYDALHDARQLKQWLNEQLTTTAALTKRLEGQLQQLQQQQQQQQQRSTKRDAVAFPIKTEDGEEAIAEPAEELNIRNELERLRKRVEELEGRLGTGRVGGSISSASGTTTTTTASSNSSNSSNDNEGYTFPPKQPLPPQPPQPQPRYQQQQDYQASYQREEQLPPSTLGNSNSNAPPTLAPIPHISRRLTSGRPELGRRLSSPGYPPSPSRVSGAYRVVGTSGTGSVGRIDSPAAQSEGGRTPRLAVSKSLSGSGPLINGKRDRRASISAGAVPSITVSDVSGKEIVTLNERKTIKGEPDNNSRKESERDSAGGMEPERDRGTEDMNTDQANESDEEERQRRRQRMR